MQRILIVLVAGIGDLVLASNSLRALRRGFPDAEIHLLTNSDAAPLARHYECLDRVWAFPIRELRKSRRYLLDILKLIRTLRGLSFHMTVNLFPVGSLSGSVKMGLLFWCLGPRRRVGHEAHGFDLFLTEKVPFHTFTNRHRTEAMMDVAVKAGGVPDDLGLQVFWDKGCEIRWQDLTEKRGDTKWIVGINPGGDRANKRWNPERFASVADRLAEQYRAKILLLGGPGEEDISQTIIGHMKSKAVDLAGSLTLDDLAFIISRLDLLLTNDSGPMHIAAATGTPLVAIFGPGDPALNRPYAAEDSVRILHRAVSCRPCRNIHCDETVCLDSISTDEVFEKCVEILTTHHPGAAISESQTMDPHEI